MADVEENSLVKLLETMLRESEKRAEAEEKKAAKEIQQAHKAHSLALEMAEASSESSSSTDLQLLAAIKSEGALNSQLACIVARLDERTLQLCYILALQIRALQTSMDEIEKDLKKSGILKKVKKIQDTKRELAKILKSVKEDMKKAEESRKKYLPYVG